MKRHRRPGTQLLDPRIPHAETTDAKGQQLAAGFGFDVWTEDSCRRLGGAAAGTTHIKERDMGIPCSKPFGYGRADDAGAYDSDAGGMGQIASLSPHVFCIPGWTRA